MICESTVYGGGLAFSGNAELSASRKTTAATAAPAISRNLQPRHGARNGALYSPLCRLAHPLAKTPAPGAFSRYSAVHRVLYRSSFLLHARRIGGQCLSKTGSCPLQTRLDRPYFDVQNPCNFSQRYLLIMSEDQHLSLHLRQHQHGPSNDLFQFDAQDIVLRRRRNLSPGRCGAVFSRSRFSDWFRITPNNQVRRGARFGSYEQSGRKSSRKQACTMSSASATEPVSRYANRNSGTWCSSNSSSRFTFVKW